MKLAWRLIFPVILGAAASSCGQAGSNGSSTPTTTGGGGSLSAGSAGAAPISGGAGSAGAPGAGSGGVKAIAGSAGSGAGAGGVAGSAGGASGGSSGGSGGASGGSGCAAPGTLCWDFETGAVPAGWGPSTRSQDFKGDLLVDNTKAHRGMYALHAKDFTGGTVANQGGPKKTIVFSLPPNFGPVLWGRAFVFTHTSSNMRVASHSGFFNARYARPGTTDTDITKLDWYEVATYTQAYMAIWHPPEPPGYPEWVKVSSTQQVLDDWVCLEWLFDGENGGAAQAADPRVWLNGSELTWPSPFVFSDPATTVRPTQEKVTNFTLLETGLYFYQGQPDTENLWIDDLAVGKERIGCQ